MDVVVPTANPPAGNGTLWAPDVSAGRGARGGEVEDAAGVLRSAPPGRPAVSPRPRTRATATWARLRRPALPDTQEITT